MKLLVARQTPTPQQRPRAFLPRFLFTATVFNPLRPDLVKVNEHSAV